MVQSNKMKLEAGDRLQAVILENFLKSIPIHKKSFVLQEISNFQKLLIENDYNIRSMPKGYSVRRLLNNRFGLELFKFRVNLKDRILYTFTSENLVSYDTTKTVIVFLDYCNHDSQTVRGKNLSKVYQRAEPVVDEEQWDEAIDNEYENFEYNANLIISRVINVEFMSRLLDERNAKANYCLNDEQYETIQKNLSPLFLFGSAGSGKTTIGINKCFLLCHQYASVGYFTYSEKLTSESLSLFNEICSQEGKDLSDKIDFYKFNNFLLSHTTKATFVDFPEFKIWYMSSIGSLPLGKKLKQDPFFIWREIRGVIKGLFFADWVDYECDQDELQKETCDFLFKNNYASVNNNQMRIHCTELFKIDITKYSKIKNIEILRGDINLIFNKVEKSIYKTKLLDLTAYLRLPSNYSFATQEEKRYIYEVAQIYENWKSANQKIDENDLASMAYAKIEGQPQFDYIVADEIQDLTEKQLYLMYKMVRYPNNILFSGDFNQTIQPTFFDEHRVSGLFMFRFGFKGFNIRHLVSNYRNPLSVIQFSQELFSLRAAVVAHPVKNYLEQPKRNFKGNIFLLSHNRRNFDELIQSASNRHFVSIIVPDVETKNSLGSSTSVFTVSEIKGLENDYIICYNIISSFKKLWKSVFENNKQLSYVQIFNVLYVAITRARENVCFYEEDMPSEFLAHFSEHFKNVFSFNHESLSLSRESKDDQFIEEGCRLEREYFYEQAISNFKRGGLGVNSLEILRCQARLNRQNGLRKEAAEMFMQINEYQLAADCYFEEEDFVNAIKALTYSQTGYEEIYNRCKRFNIDPVKLIGESKVSWKNVFMQIFMKHIHKKTSIRKSLTKEIGQTLLETKESLHINHHGRF